ncbi:hypothetical protein A4G23_03186 [Streptomyces rubrolavendulae]|uniref:Uncharacterized protein n=1 Tax=Streptomyces rubrolavendulae TaxID=285473 RepID=A0A1D8G4E0_9ACTN|nr:hypothetical protein A4G23_03186 [Streptomyces rubrolavendulae]
MATAAVREPCRPAATRYGLRTLRAAIAHRNAASRKVLAKAGFVPAGPADPAHLGGEPGTWYRRDLAHAIPPEERPRGDRQAIAGDLTSSTPPIAPLG